MSFKVKLLNNCYGNYRMLADQYVVRAHRTVNYILVTLQFTKTRAKVFLS